VGLASSFQVADQQSPVNSPKFVAYRIRDFEGLLLSKMTACSGIIEKGLEAEFAGTSWSFAMRTGDSANKSGRVAISNIQ
jgi:hypothetical protein